MRGHVRVAEVLLNHGADPELRTTIGQTPLMWACGRGRAEAADLLLRHNARTDPADCNGDTALHRAAFNGRIACVAALLAHGADATVGNSAGLTPRDMAVSGKHAEVVSVFDVCDFRVLFWLVD